MRKLATRRSALIALIALTAACVHQDDIPSPAGPSEFGLSITITATPDAINQDGASQSAIVVYARGPNGAAVSGVPLRLDMAVGFVVQDFGTLSTKSIVTASDGRAAAVYVAPPAPPPLAGGSDNIVTIIATPTGSNFQAASSRTAEIRLVPPGVILPPAQTPTAVFTFPTPVSVDDSTIFDASASCSGPISGGVCMGTGTITSYSWTFGDGSTGTGRTRTHTFDEAKSYPVTLTVTNDRGLAASSTQQVEVVLPTPPASPVAAFTFSPASPATPPVAVNFDGASSTTPSGAAINNYRWNFGDGTIISGPPEGAAGPPPAGTFLAPQHTYVTTGSFTVTLTVTDTNGLTGSTTGTVTIVP